MACLNFCDLWNSDLYLNRGWLLNINMLAFCQFQTQEKKKSLLAAVSTWLSQEEAESH